MVALPELFTKSTSPLLVLNVQLVLVKLPLHVIVPLVDVSVPPESDTEVDVEVKLIGTALVPPSKEPEDTVSDVAVNEDASPNVNVPPLTVKAEKVKSLEAEAPTLELDASKVPALIVKLPQLNNHNPLNETEP